MVNGIVSLTSLFDVSLLMYRNARDFCVLISCPVTLLHSLISSGNILVESLEFSMYSICHLQIEFYFFFSDLDSFYFFLFSDCCG